MPYHFTTTAIIGAIFAISTNAFPVVPYGRALVIAETPVFRPSNDILPDITAVEGIGKLNDKEPPTKTSITISDATAVIQPRATRPARPASSNYPEMYRKHRFDTSFDDPEAMARQMKEAIEFSYRHRIAASAMRVAPTPNALALVERAGNERRADTDTPRKEIYPTVTVTRSVGDGDVEKLATGVNPHGMEFGKGFGHGPVVISGEAAGGGETDGDDDENISPEEAVAGQS